MRKNKNSSHDVAGNIIGSFKPTVDEITIESKKVHQSGKELIPCINWPASVRRLNDEQKSSVPRGKAFIPISDWAKEKLDAQKIWDFASSLPEHLKKQLDNHFNSSRGHATVIDFRSSNEKRPYNFDVAKKNVIARTLSQESARDQARRMTEEKGNQVKLEVTECCFSTISKDPNASFMFFIELQTYCGKKKKILRRHYINVKDETVKYFVGELFEDKQVKHFYQRPVVSLSTTTDTEKEKGNSKDYY